MRPAKGSTPISAGFSGAWGCVGCLRRALPRHTQKGWFCKARPTCASVCIAVSRIQGIRGVRGKQVSSVKPSNEPEVHLTRLTVKSGNIGQKAKTCPNNIQREGREGPSLSMKAPKIHEARSPMALTQVQRVLEEAKLPEVSAEESGPRGPTTWAGIPVPLVGFGWVWLVLSCWVWWALPVSSCWLC